MPKQKGCWDIELNRSLAGDQKSQHPSTQNQDLLCFISIKNGLDAVPYVFSPLILSKGVTSRQGGAQ